MAKAHSIVGVRTSPQPTGSEGYEIDIHIEDNKIIFPADKHEAKRLLQPVGWGELANPNKLANKSVGLRTSAQPTNADSGDWCDQSGDEGAG